MGEAFRETAVYDGVLSDGDVTFAGVAHDFSNLLSGLSLNVHLLRHAEREEDRAQALDCLDRGLATARALARRMLACSRGDGAGCDEAALARVVEDCRSLAVLGTSVRVDTRIEADLWTIPLDPVAMHQVMSNLMLNAVEAMPRGGHLLIEAGNVTRDDGCFVKLLIRDDGPGIDAALRLHIFRPYFTTKGSGTGLGLSNCYQIVKAAGGSIEVESTPGQGTTFCILLPAADVRRIHQQRQENPLSA